MVADVVPSYTLLFTEIFLIPSALGVTSTLTKALDELIQKGAAFNLASA